MIYTNNCLKHCVLVVLIQPLFDGNMYSTKGKNA
nr:MAG TPA: hypothetical protein [Caudoviricetes sp.]